MSKTTDYKNQFILEKYDRINLTVPKGTKDLLKNHCDKNGLSINGYILSLIKKDLNLYFPQTKSSKKEEMDIFLF